MAGFIGFDGLSGSKCDRMDVCR